MGSSELREALMASTDDVMEVDTSFLDAYRSGGTEGLAKFRETQQQAVEPEAEVDEPEPESETEPDIDHDVDPDLDPNVDVEPELEPEIEPERSESETSGGERGGSAAGSAPEGSTSSQKHQPDGPDLPEQDEEHVEAAGPPPGRHDEVIEAEASRAVSLEHTDHQDAVQSASGFRGGSSSGATLPSTGFKLVGASSQPTVRALPEKVVSALREQLRRVIVRDLDVSETTAREFSERLSQVALVTAFLLAHLDLDVDIDASTAKAAELFRAEDPLLGRAVERLDALTEHEHARDKELERMRTELQEVHTVSRVLEQLLAYSVADRAENLGRGTAGVEDLDLSHRSALNLRDRAREATRKQRKIERDRDGRPIR